jgi:hypothetical protein
MKKLLPLFLVTDLFRLAQNVATWLKIGATRAARSQQLTKLRTDAGSKTARDTAGQIEQLNQRDAALHNIRTFLGGAACPQDASSALGSMRSTTVSLYGASQ